MPILGESIEEFVLKQVGDRQKFFGQSKDRDPKLLQYMSSRTAWVKLASGVKIEDISTNSGTPSGLKNSNLKYPKNYVLFNGTSRKGKYMREGIGFEDSYDTSDKDYGIVPMPGIINVDVKAKNRGSIKEATVKIKCWSRRQFEIIDRLYLRLGYNMLLEYGWNQYVSSSNSYGNVRSTLISSDWWVEDDNRGIQYWLREIQKLRVKYHACYDGFFGKVVNFDWSIDVDGSYDITVKLITHGDIIESISIPISDNGDSSKTNSSVRSYIKQTLFKDKALRRCYNNTFFTIDETDDLKGDGLFKYNKLSYMSTTEGKDKLSQHLFNIKFIGRGIENMQLYYWGYSGLTEEEKENVVETGAGENVGKGDVPTFVEDSYDPPHVNNEKAKAKALHDQVYANFASQLSYYENNFINHIGRWDLFQPGHKTFGGIQIGPSERQKNNDNNVSEGSNEVFINDDILAGDDGGLYHGKQCGSVFFSSLTGNGARNGFSYQDALVLYSEINTPTKIGKKKDKSLYKFSAAVYVRLQYILYYLNEYCIPYQKNTKDRIVNINWKSEIPMYTNQTSTTSQISYDPAKVISATPTWSPKVNKEIRDLPENQITQGDIGNGNVGDDRLIWKQLQLFTKSTFPLQANTGMDAEFAIDYIPSEDGSDKKIPYLRGKNLYLNVDYMMSILGTPDDSEKNPKIDIFSILKKMCDTINAAYGNVNNLEPVIDTSTNELNIVDNTSFPQRKQLFKHLGMKYVEPTAPQMLQTYGYRRVKEGKHKKTVTNFLRNFKLNTKISKELASMITIGATATGGTTGLDSTSFSRFNQGIINRFDPEYIQPSSENPTKKQKTPLVSFLLGCKLSKEEYDYPYTNYLGFNTKTGIQLQNTFYVRWQPDKIEKNVSTMYDLYQYLEQKTYEKSDSGSPTIGFIPFSLDFTLDGISGYKIYNLVNSSLSFLPSNYPKSLEFILSGVNHKISNNDWTTELTTIACPKANGNKLIIDYDLGSSGTNEAPMGEDIVITGNEIISWNGTAGADNENGSKKGYRKSFDNIRLIIKELKALGVINPIAIVASLSVIAKESGFTKLLEGSYKTTSPERMHKKFDAFKAAYGPYNSDVKQKIKAIQQDETKLWSWMYGSISVSYGDHGGVNGWLSGYPRGSDPVRYGDGEIYRGRGFNQITFKSNYKDYGKKAFGDVNYFVDKVNGVSVGGDPNRLSDPPIAAKAAAAFFVNAVGRGPDAKAKNYNNWGNIEEAIAYAARANNGWNGPSTGHIESALEKYQYWGFSDTFSGPSV